jgi:hypothetical protein
MEHARGKYDTCTRTKRWLENLKWENHLEDNDEGVGRHYNESDGVCSHYLDWLIRAEDFVYVMINVRV